MNSKDRFESPTTSPASATTASSTTRADTTDHEHVVECILDDCFFAVGQAVGLRKTVNYNAVVWWHDHYRARFLRALEAFGNRWIMDRQNVTGVAMMFGERAVRYAEDAEAISLAVFQQAAVDVERYCLIHSRRRSRRAGLPGDVERPLLTGVWCTF